MKKTLYIIIIMLTCALAAFAQKSIAIKGEVSSHEDGKPVLGATILVSGYNKGTTTDINGRFRLNVPPGAKTLTISYLGMKTQIVKIKPYLKIVLYADTEALDEVVVIGYGSARKVGTVVGSAQTVKADKLKNTPSGSVLDALQGQVAGLQSLTSGGVAGDDAVFLRIHGMGSIGAGSSPLFVCDGIPVSSRTVMSMNPNDIKNVTVLKDASATSIYGSRAANGVIYVTTHKGQFNTTARISFRTKYGWSSLCNKQFYKDMMNGDELKDFWVNSGLKTEEEIYQRYTSKGYVYNTKWYDVYQDFNTPQTMNDMTVQGGGNKMSYIFAASQFHQRGTTIGNYYDRYTVRANIDARTSKYIKTGINLSFSFSESQRNYEWGYSGGNNTDLTGGLSYMINPLYPSHDPKTGEPLKWYDWGAWNQKYYIDNNPEIVKRYTMHGNGYIQLIPFKGFNIMTRLGTDTYFTRRNWHRNPSYIPAKGWGWKGKRNDFGYSNTITNTAEYKFSINRMHNFTFLLGQEFTVSNWEYFMARSQGQTDDRLMQIDFGRQSTYRLGENSSRSKFLSYFGRFDYGLKDKYYIDFSCRKDGSSRFGKGERYATFWAAGVLWKISKEPFMSNVRWLRDLDAKISYGTQGNAAIGDYASLGTVNETVDYGQEPARRYGKASNGKLTWEKQYLLTTGVKGVILNKLRFNIEYYRRITKDMLMWVPYPYTSGFTSMNHNVGSLLNHGIDIELNYTFLRGKDYYLSLRSTFNYNKSKITELFQDRDRWENARTTITYVVGSPIMYYWPVYAGIDKEDGAPMWYLPGDNKDKLTKKETTKKYDQQSLTQNTGKKRYAPIFGGFGFSGRWRDFSFYAGFSYVLGKWMINNDQLYYENPNYYDDRTYNKCVRDYWTPDNKNAEYPSWKEGHYMRFDTHILQNASFLRLKNVQLTYTLPKKILVRQDVLKDVRITLTGRNLWTVTGYKGMDPEMFTNVSIGQVGNTKQFLVGAEFTF